MLDVEVSHWQANCSNPLKLEIGNLKLDEREKDNQEEREGVEFQVSSIEFLTGRRKS